MPLPACLDLPQARFRLFDSIGRFLGQLAARAPLVIILDDLQGADEPSLRLLQFVVRELRDAPVLLVGTFRDVGLTREHPLAATFAEVLREPNTRRLALSGLSAAEVGCFIEMTTGVAPDAALAALNPNSISVNRESPSGDLFDELVEIGAAEFPPEGLGDGLVVLLEPQ